MGKGERLTGREGRKRMRGLGEKESGGERDVGREREGREREVGRER